MRNVCVYTDQLISNYEVIHNSIIATKNKADGDLGKVEVHNCFSSILLHKV